jgi:hypothetical protein
LWGIDPLEEVLPVTTDSTLPPLLLAAYEADCTDWALVAALADAAADAGEEVVADCLRWVWQKRLSPQGEFGDCGWYWNVDGKYPSDSCRRIPRLLRDRYDEANGNFKWCAYDDSGSRQIDRPRSTLLQRLVRCWLRATEAERAAAWAWEPRPEQHQ